MGIFLEFKKSFLRPSIIIITFILILLNVLVFVEEYAYATRRSIQTRDEYMYFYPIVEGKIEREKVNELLNLEKENLQKYNQGIVSYEDEKGNLLYTHANRITLETMIEDLQYTYFYPLKIDGIINKAKLNIEDPNLVNYTNEKKKNQKIIDAYSNRYIKKFGLTRGYELLFNYKISSFFLLLVLVLPLSTLFAEEKESNRYQILVGQETKSRCIKHKLIAAYIFIFILSISFYIIDILCFNHIWAMNALFNPIYSLKLYQNTFLNINIFAFIVINFLFMFVAYCFMGLIFIITSLNTKKVSTSLGINYIVLIFIIGLTDFVKISFNPFNLLVNKDMFKMFSAKKILFYTIYEPWYYLVLSLFCIVLLMGVLRRSAKKW